MKAWLKKTPFSVLDIFVYMFTTPAIGEGQNIDFYVDPIDDFLKPN